MAETKKTTATVEAATSSKGAHKQATYTNRLLDINEEI